MCVEISTFGRWALTQHEGANYTLKSIFCNSAKVSVDSIQAHAHSQVINATTSAFQLNLDLVFGCGMSGCNGTDKMAYGALCDGLNPGMLAKIGIDSDIVLKETCSRAKNTTIPKNAPPKAIPVATALYEARSYLFGTYLGIGLAPYTEYKEHVCRNYGAALKEIIPHYSAQNLSLMHVYNQACNTTNYSVALPIWRAKVFANTIMFSSEDPNLRRAICNNRFPSYNWNVAQWINTGYEFISTEAYLEILEPWCIQLGLADLPDGPRFIVDGLMGDMLKVRGLKSSSPKPSGT